MISVLLKRRTIQTLLLSAGVLVTSAHPAQASPIGCIADTLDHYINNLGAAGCSVGSVVFSGFSLLGLPNFSLPISPSQIQLSPTDGGTNVQLAASIVPAVTAGPEDTREVLFGYNATGAQFTRVLTSLAGATADDDASVSFGTNYCVGSVFSLALSCPGLVTTIFDPALGIDQLTDASPLSAPASLVGIVSDIAIGGGITGSATAGGPATTRFNVVGATTPPSAVPEPFTGALVGGGLLLAGLRRRRARH